MSEINIAHEDAERIIEHLGAWSTVLRAAFPQRLIDILHELDQTGVLEPLRYGPPMGPEYVADSADELRRQLEECLSGGRS